MINTRVALPGGNIRTGPVVGDFYHDFVLFGYQGTDYLDAYDEAYLYLVGVGPDGQEGARVPLPVSDLRNLSGFLERLKRARIPSALYRVYYSEPGLPPQMVLEFRKAGNTIGDPVREPGRGTNPL